MFFRYVRSRLSKRNRIPNYPIPAKNYFRFEYAIVHLPGAALINTDVSEQDELKESGIENEESGTLDAGNSDDSSSTASDVSQMAETMKVSVHRLVQDALIYSRAGNQRQAIFDAAIKVIYKAFPAQMNGESLGHETQTCTRLIPHIVSLSARYQDFEHDNESPLIPSEEFGLLLKSCIW
jgi:hypothetical protein